MIVSNHPMNRSDLTDYLKIDNYLSDAITARALLHAFDTRVIDLLSAHPQGLPSSQWPHGLTGDTAGSQLLLEILAEAGVIEPSALGLRDTNERTPSWRLTDHFRQALLFRDLLEVKIQFSLVAASDYLDHFSLLLRGEAEFFERSRMMELFDYGRCLETDESSLAAAWRWMRFTTALTRYEAPACLERHSMAPYQQVIDVGGNSGEFARQMCAANPQLHATVLDLPAVCEVGRRYLRATAEADRVHFAPGTALTDNWPGTADLITFKSMLHDWPDEGVEILLQRAMQHLKPNGTILIYERDHFDKRRQAIRFSDLPMLMFFRSLRGPQRYREILECGDLEVHVETIQLEMPFFVLTARRSG